MNSVNELNELREKSRSKVALRQGEARPEGSKIRLDLLTCGGTGCHASSLEKIIENLKSELVKRGIQRGSQSGQDRLLRSLSEGTDRCDLPG